MIVTGYILVDDKLLPQTQKPQWRTNKIILYKLQLIEFMSYFVRYHYL